MKKELKGFVSGALSATSGKVRLEVFYEKIGDVLEKEDIHAFIPHRDANPRTTPGLTFDEIYKINMEKIKQVDILIAYVGEPSTGTGMEIQQATREGINVIVLCEQDKPLSKLVMGCPGVIDCIHFETFDEALEKLEKKLELWKSGKLKPAIH